MLARELAFLRRRSSRHLFFTLGLCALGLAAGVPLALGQAAEDRALGWLAFATLGAYEAVFLASWLQNRRGFRPLERALEGALRGGEVRVTRIRSGRMVPSTDFEILDIRDGRGTPVRLEVRGRGERLTPLRTIGKRAKEELLKEESYPRDGEIMEGRLEDLEALIAARGKSAEQWAGRGEGKG